MTALQPISSNISAENIAGMGAMGVPVAILSAQPDPGPLDHGSDHADEGRRRANHDLAFEPDILEHAGEQPRFLERCSRAIHFPVARHQRLRRFLSHFSPLPRFLESY